MAIIKNSGTCFLQYPIIFNTCWSFFLDCGVCKASVFSKVPGGTEALPAIHHVSRNLISGASPWNFASGTTTALFKASHTEAASVLTAPSESPPI